MSSYSWEWNTGRLGILCLCASSRLFGFPTLRFFIMAVIVLLAATRTGEPPPFWSSKNLREKTQAIHYALEAWWLLRTRYEANHIWPNAYSWFRWIVMIPIMLSLKFHLLEFFIDSNGWLQPLIYGHSICKTLPSLAFTNIFTCLRGVARTLLWDAKRTPKEEGTRCQEEPTFEYRYLEGDREIRLFELACEDIFHESAPRGSLVHVSLNDNPEYEAISYTWDKNISPKEIKIDGKIMEVTANVLGILKTQRSMTKKRLLWIDSICINQKDNKEKGSQVEMMGDIYHNAKRVIIWLGDSHDSSQAFRLLEEMQLYNQYPLLHRGMLLDRHFRSWIYHSRWVALARFFRHRWFERAWVVQEVALARHAIIYYGGRYLEWRTLMNALAIFGNHKAGRNFNELLQLPPDTTIMSRILSPRYLRVSVGPVHAAAIDVLQNNIRRGVNDMTLKQALRHFRNLNSENPKDRVYALRSVVNDPKTGPLEVDYFQSDQALYIKVARYLLTQDDPLRLLSSAGIGDERMECLPSWVPDFSNTWRPCELALNSDGQTKYRSSGNSTPFLVLPPSGQELHVKGSIIDEILSISSVFDLRLSGDEKSPTSSVEHNLLRSKIISDSKLIAESGLRGNKHYRTGELWTDAYWRTITGNRTPTEYPIPAIYGKYLETLENAWKMVETKKFTVATLLDLEFVAAADIFGLPLSLCAYGRRFAVTRHGYFGMVPPKTIVGDRVAIVLGTQTPFVLRPGLEGGEYHLVGDCYMHGMMDGEVLLNGPAAESIMLQ